MGLLKSKAVVLQYQNISHDKDNFLETWISCDSFREQLEYISKNNISIIPLEDAVAYIKGGLRLKQQSFSLTFDTGFIELYTLCFPLIKKYGFPATFFIRPDTVGKKETIKGRDVEYMNWNQIRELKREGMTIGFYGCKGQWLSNTPLKEIREEIVKGEALFRQELKNRTVFYAVKDDAPTKQMIDLFKEKGLEAVFCQTPTRQRVHHYAIGRVQIDDNDFNIFLIKLTRTYIIFKDSRYWKQIRQCRLDKVVHFFSNIINRIKKKEIY